MEEVGILMSKLEEATALAVGCKDQCNQLLNRIKTVFKIFIDKELDPIAAVTNFWTMLGGSFTSVFQSFDGSEPPPPEPKEVTPLENFSMLLKEVIALISKFNSESYFLSTWMINDHIEEFRSFHLTLDVILHKLENNGEELIINTIPDSSDIQYASDVQYMIEQNFSKYAPMKKYESRILSNEIVKQIECLLRFDETVKDLPTLGTFNVNYLTYQQDGSVVNGKLRGFPVSIKFGSASTLKDEAISLQLFQLPGVLRFIGVNDANAPTIMITEHYSFSLSTLIYKKESRSKLGRDWNILTKFSILADCATTFAFLHSLKITHRNIRPDSILILPSGQIKVTDFGLKPLSLTDNVALFYVAPELIIYPNEFNWCEVTDMYSFGVTMNEVLTERSPYPANFNVLTSMTDSRGCARPDLYQPIGKEHKMDIVGVLGECLNADFDQRWSFSQCAVDLHYLSEGKTSSHDDMTNYHIKAPNGSYSAVDNVFMTSDIFTGYYTGSLMGDVRHGKGSMKCLDGSYYDGEWDRNTRHGKGRAIEFGDEYIGAFCNDLMEGQGVMNYSDGSSYEGEWVHSAMEGNGSMIYVDGSTYVGQWKKDAMDGYGTMQYCNRDIYEGNWHDNKMSGAGTMRYANGSVYNGEWKNGTMEGFGIMQYASKDVYEGNWFFDQKEGHGIMKWFNGDIYDGDWKNNAMDGQGIMKSANGDVYSGEWMDNAIEGEGRMIYANGDVYDGNWLCEIKEGLGKMTFANGDEYDGEWKAGIMHGRGTMTYASGSVHSGVWLNGTLEFREDVKHRASLILDAPPELISSPKNKRASILMNLFPAVDTPHKPKTPKATEVSIKPAVEATPKSSRASIMANLFPSVESTPAPPEPDLPKETEVYKASPVIETPPKNNRASILMNLFPNVEPTPQEPEQPVAETPEVKPVVETTPASAEIDHPKESEISEVEPPVDSSPKQDISEPEKLEEFPLPLESPPESPAQSPTQSPGSAVDGYGKVIHPNGDVYEGNFLGGKSEGLGKMTFANGDEYDGEWKAGIMHGRGTMTEANGSINSGVWLNGSLEFREDKRRASLSFDAPPAMLTSPKNKRASILMNLFPSVESEIESSELQYPLPLESPPESPTQSPAHLPPESPPESELPPQLMTRESSKEDNTDSVQESESSIEKVPVIVSSPKIEKKFRSAEEMEQVANARRLSIVLESLSFED